ncbi:TetR/AcrR family transcriptional regulator [Algiphilus sp. W345]|uniref:TetR/AcrR family transcriptional regulator n=1 Tax=Banduia mediterranea TaxID=3075609 RepID=A0ABU2WF02_9GAMM|nr:TetR/AcrR family transcriptional regulator [Algiphilus sp. W345]MDT0495879.1 TetR/AcrR family transcriptional regulator [Algiphilus sp. W345]
MDTPRQNLTADDWSAAALEAVASSGIEAVAVEPLARSLGVTKGSFYWHFPSREALMRRALELWERQETDDMIIAVADASDPYDRIVKLFKRANASHRAGRLYLALAAASDHAHVGTVVRRVSARRMNYLHECYQALGLGEPEAKLWSTFAYATFIGNQQVHRDAPETFPEGAEFSQYFKLMIKTLIPRARDIESARVPGPADKHAAPPGP